MEEQKKFSNIESQYIFGCVFSPDLAYRYILERVWGEGKTVAFIGLNPSTADEVKNDATIRRCLGFARSWGYCRLLMVNLFAFCATLPIELTLAKDPIGSDNDEWVKRALNHSDLIVSAWGIHGVFNDRDRSILNLTDRQLHCLGRSKDGHPLHPLRLRKDILPVLYR